MEEKDDTVVEQETTEETPDVAEVEETEVSEDAPEEHATEPEEPSEDIDWKERALKAEKLIEKNKKKAKEQPKEKADTPSDDAVLARLENRGVMEADDQEYVLKFAKVEGLSPVEALNDPLVQDRLTRSKREREQRDATTPANNRIGQKSDEVDRWVKKYKRDGSLPDNNPALTSKILDRLQAE